jgi:hypothetical protein
MGRSTSAGHLRKRVNSVVKITGKSALTDQIGRCCFVHWYKSVFFELSRSVGRCRKVG